MLALLLGVILSMAGVSPARDMRAIQSRLAEKYERPDRYVDMGVELRVVEHDPDGKKLIAGAPPLRVLRYHRFGGMVDTVSDPPVYSGPSVNPQVWYCSTEQEPVLLHEENEPDRLLVYGSEGAGKTTAQVIWHALRILENIGEGREGGQTAPTEARLVMFRNEAAKLWPPDWYTHKRSEDVYYFVDGSRVRLVSTHQQSEAEGSRVQGYTWSWAGSDELQDHSAYDSDIESRGRGARDGRYKRMATATAKDSPTWRTFRDGLLTSGLWKKHTLLGRNSPFVWARFWDEKKKTMSAREYARRVEAQDVAPENSLYETWDREHSLRRIPHNAVDVTSQVLAKLGANLHVLVGFDPGKIVHVAVAMKAYKLPGEKFHRWWIVGELNSYRSTIERHALEASRWLGERFGIGVNGRRALWRGDPYGNTPSDAQPDKTVYTVLRQQEGFDVRPAAYKAGTADPGKISKEARIDVVRTLLCNASDQRRLLMDCDERRQPAAPKCAEAFESLERDGLGRAEVARKDENDMTHWPAAVGYGLFSLERPVLGGSIEVLK